MANIGFIGLGIMGRAMARNLMKAGHTLLVYDIVVASRDALVADGAGSAESAKDAAARSELVITMLPDGPEVEAAVLGPGGVLEGAHKGLTVVDMSSISPGRRAEGRRRVRGGWRGLPRRARQRRRAEGD